VPRDHAVDAEILDEVFRADRLVDDADPVAHQFPDPDGLAGLPPQHVGPPERGGTSFGTAERRQHGQLPLSSLVGGGRLSFVLPRGDSAIPVDGQDRPRHWPRRHPPNGWTDLAVAY